MVSSPLPSSFLLPPSLPSLTRVKRPDFGVLSGLGLVFPSLYPGTSEPHSQRPQKVKNVRGEYNVESGGGVGEGTLEGSGDSHHQSPNTKPQSLYTQIQLKE